MFQISTIVTSFLFYPEKNLKIRILLHSIFSPFHRVRVVVVEIALAARETGHGSLEPRGSVRFRGRAVQNRVVVRRWTGMGHAGSTTTRESVPKRAALRVSARPRLARVSAIAHVHPAQSLGQDSDLCKRNRFVNDD